MQFKFGTWNVNYCNLKSAHVDLLRRENCHLLALQEVKPHFHKALADVGLFDWSVYSLELRLAGMNDGHARQLGCSIFGRKPFHLESSALLNDLAFPERALVLETTSILGNMSVCSFHIPPGASWGQIKPQTIKSIATWLSDQTGTRIFGIDANAPKVDHPNPHANQWWWDDEPLLLGSKPLHSLRDSFRVQLENQPDRKTIICRECPTGPLAVSHIRGRGKVRTPCRYDFI